MSASQVVTVVACMSQLALALMCIVRAARSPLAVPLALLCLDIFGWSGAGLAYELSGRTPWTLLDHTLSPLTAPLALAFALTFVGKRRAFRSTLLVSWVACGSLGLASALGFVVPALSAFVASKSHAWAVWLLSASIPTMVFAVVALVMHYRDSIDPIERARTRLIFAALAIGTAFGLTEELSNLAPPFPPLGNIGMALAALPLALVALRLRLFERDVSLRAASWVLASAGLAVIAMLIVFRYFDPSAAMLLLGCATVTLALIAGRRRWMSEAAGKRARHAQLATLGRLSAQMAHDLKNPLAALKGAAQLLREDLAHPGGIDRVKFADLMLDQIDRIDGLVDVYGRLARIDPAREPIDVNDLVRSVLALQSFATERVDVRIDLAEGLPSCRADRGMLTRVLENLVRNAMEAMPDGGVVTVRTSRAEGDGSITVAVQDTGVGMDARTRERALDEFFTTKPKGSGLGLAFVRRVVEAHRGAVSLESTQGRGTVVRVRLPVG
jgi:signal transduction histidine kinase